MRKEIPMPFSPKLSSSTDVSSFETMFTSELPLDSVSEAAKESAKTGGLLGFFGLGKGNGGKDAKHETDASFAGFTFTREDAVVDAPTDETTHDVAKGQQSDIVALVQATAPVPATAVVAATTPAPVAATAPTSDLPMAPTTTATITDADTNVDAATNTSR